MYHSVVGDYIPQLTICASAQARGNEYRVVDSLAEFRIGTRCGRVLTDDEIRWHFRLSRSRRLLRTRMQKPVGLELKF